MPIPRWVARLNLRITNPILSPLAKRLPGMGIIVHTGRKSNRVYRTPIMVFRRDSGFVIALTYGARSQWVQNVLANGGCRLESEGRVVQLSSPRVFHDERRSAMPALVRFVLGLLNVSDFMQLQETSRAVRVA